ncbi:MAG: DUF4386 domain-containing protein [Corynebacterium casei]|nr:DUF4386 domain-containing protein [Corynebacterium casei]
MRTPARTLDTAQQSTYRLAAGFILLAMAIASPIGFLVALPQEQFTITAFVGFVVVLLDICVALLLIPILRSGGTALANWASVLRIFYATGLFTATILLVIRQNGELFTQVWDYSLALFGFHLIVAGIAMCRSTELPTIIGVLLLIAGAGYLFDSVTTMFNVETMSLSEFTFIGEVALLLWLLWSGFRLRKGSRTTSS